MDFGDALNKALREEMRRDPRVYCIGEDIVLGVPFGVTTGLCEEFGPARVLNAPISETAIRDPDPVLVFEHRGLYRVSGEVGDVETLVPLGSADVKRAGRDVTVIATARMVHESLAAARRLAEEGIEVEVVDPRSLVPL